MVISSESSSTPSSSSVLPSTTTQSVPLPSPRSTWLNRAIFLGTGTSGQVPAIHCISTETIDCAACADAIKPKSKNRRGCCSIALIGGGRKVVLDGEETYEEEQLIVIDAGPTFYGACVDYFRPNKVPRRIAGVLLTHGHADAILGLDNLRAWTMGGMIQGHVDIYLTKETLKVVVGTFPYLADVSKATGGGGVGALRWNIIDPHKAFTIGKGTESIQVTPLPVYHGFESRGGPPFDTLGFRVDSLSYISDVHHIPPTTAKLMAGSDCVVIDSLMPKRHPSHFSLSQAISLLLSLPQNDDGEAQADATRALRPSLGILTDITHRIEHHALQRDLDRFSSLLKTWIRSTPQKSRMFNGEGHDRKGEGSGPRWWSEVWDEDKGEITGRLEVEPALTANHDMLNGHTVNGSVVGDMLEEWRHVPDLRVAWDGMVIRFSREKLTPSASSLAWRRDVDKSAL